MKVFLSGIAGTGMSSLAGLFKEKGYEVYGSDAAFYPPVGPMLKRMGVTIFEGYSEKNIPGDADFCIIGNIISRGNPEAEFILNHKLTFYSMAEALKKFFIRDGTSIVVAGTHGKTTISSFTAFMLSEAGLDPGYFIGGKPLDLRTNHCAGDGKYFVSEGDEYETAFFDRSSKFLKYFPDILILTALEYDHLDFFKTEREYCSAFRNLVNQVPSKGVIISNSDHPMNAEAVSGAVCPVVTYGGPGSDHVIGDIEKKDKGFTFSLRSGSKVLMFETAIPGRYNLTNFAAGIITGLYLGIPVEKIRRAVKDFTGVERRLVILAEKGNTVFMEDFAHHPTSVRAVLSGIRESYPERKITVLFDTGSWSLKNKYFEESLSDSLSEADEIYIKNPENTGKIPENERMNPKNLKDKIKSRGKTAEVFEHIAQFENVLEEIDTNEKRVVILMSNGSFGNLQDRIRNAFSGTP